MNENDNVLCEVQGRIAVVTLNAPPMNPLDRAMMSGLQNTFEELLLERDLRAVILTGSGRAFAAGANIQELASWTADASLELNGRGQRLVDRIETFPAPVIAAINGYALGGGLEIAMGCDIRIASARAKMGLPEAKLGIIPGYGGTARLPRLVGMGQAKKLVFTGAHIAAAEALEIGLVDEVVEPEQLLIRAGELAAAIAENAPIAVRMAKATMNRCRGMPVAEALREELQRARDCYASNDSARGIAAFLQKKSAVFEND